MSRYRNLAFTLCFWAGIVAGQWLRTAQAAAATVNATSPLTQAQVDAAGDFGTLVFATGEYRCAAQLKPRAGQTWRGTTQIQSTFYLDTTSFPGFTIPGYRSSAVKESVIVAPPWTFAARLETNGVKFLNLSFR